MRYKWSEEKIVRRLKEGFGSGNGLNYKPWIHVLEGGSIGFRHRVKGWKTNRIHQLLSKLEFDTFLSFEWAEDIKDIREQYPLKRNITKEIADNMGINHPMYPATDIPIVMTTDFLLTIKTNDSEKLIAVAVKPSAELEKPRVLEKLEVERQYWVEKGRSWGIVTEKDINKTFTKNMDYIHNSKSHSLKYEQNYINSLMINFSERIYNSRNSTFQECFDKFDRDNNLDIGSSVSLFRYALANKIIKIDMFQDASFDKKIKELLLDEES